MRQDEGMQTVPQALARMDEGWAVFTRLLSEFPAEHLDERISSGWSRKQMLAHIAAWHDLTSDGLAEFARDGEKHDVAENDDVVNARVARAAEGRTTGEVRDWLDASFRRLRRQVAQLSDEQLAANGGWAASFIAGSSYDHYPAHADDLEVR
jgi:hypothetical protein